MRWWRRAAAATTHYIFCPWCLLANGNVVRSTDRPTERTKRTNETMMMMKYIDELFRNARSHTRILWRNFLKWKNVMKWNIKSANRDLCSRAEIRIILSVRGSKRMCRMGTHTRRLMYTFLNRTKMCMRPSVWSVDVDVSTWDTISYLFCANIFFALRNRSWNMYMRIMFIARNHANLAIVLWSLSFCLDRDKKNL